MRREVQRRIAETEPEWRAAQSERIARSVLASPPYRAARRVLLFYPMPNEVDLARVAMDARCSAKQAYVPRIDWAKRTMVAVRVRRWPMGQPSPGWKQARPNLWQPGPSSRAISPDRIDLVIVPGLAFDASGGRLGWGGGFYDRFLASIRAFRMGVAFDVQCVERVPMESWDERMDAVAVSGRYWTVPRRSPAG